MKYEDFKLQVIKNFDMSNEEKANSAGASNATDDHEAMETDDVNEDVGARGAGGSVKRKLQVPHPIKGESFNSILELSDASQLSKKQKNKLKNLPGLFSSNQSGNGGFTKGKGGGKGRNRKGGKGGKGGGYKCQQQSSNWCNYCKTNNGMHWNNCFNNPANTSSSKGGKGGGKGSGNGSNDGWSNNQTRLNC